MASPRSSPIAHSVSRPRLSARLAPLLALPDPADPIHSLRVKTAFRPFIVNRGRGSLSPNHGRQFGQSRHNRQDSDPRTICASSRSDGTGDASNNDLEDAGEDLRDKLGDWREFRARLVRTGDLPTVLEPSVQEESTEPAGPDGTSTASTQTKHPEISETSSEEASTIPLFLPIGSNPKRMESREKAGPSPWAHSLSTPEQGCLVIAHPSAFGTSQQYFNQAVIFLFAHGPDGSAGVILNRPSQYTVGQVAGIEELLPEFAASPLYLGGDVGPTSMICLHGVEDLSANGDVVPVCPGVYLGGAKGAKNHIRSGKSSAMDYRWFTRYAGWGPGQLEREVRSGFWFLAASSPDMVLKHCIALDKPLWRQVMELMGGEHEVLSKKTYGEL